ncbi:MAG: hypothetical protein KBB54_01265 [Candidatus Pacebacteria bacterium]|nr:hypothetical protein [Candidatus Paceibacterota bacterium]
MKKVILIGVVVGLFYLWPTMTTTALILVGVWDTYGEWWSKNRFNTTSSRTMGQEPISEFLKRKRAEQDVSIEEQQAA